MTNRLALHVMTRRSTRTSHRTFRLRYHRSPGTICSVERSSRPSTAVVRAPASLAGPDSVVEAIERAGSSAIDEGSVTQDGNVVEAEVPDGSVDHAVAAECHEGTNDSTCEDVVPVVVLVNSESATDQAGTEKRSVDGNKLPHGGVVVGKNLELRVEVEIQEHEASEGGSSVARGHGLEGVVDLFLVTCADASVEHDRAEAVGDVGACGSSRLEGVGVKGEVGRDHRLADGEEMRAETSNEPLDEDLEDGSHDQGVQKTNGGVVDIPERAHPDLADEEDGEGDEEGHESGGPNGDDLVAQRVGKLGVNNLSISEGDCRIVSNGDVECVN